MYITICPIVKLIKTRRISDNGRIKFLINSMIIIIGIIIIGEGGVIL